MANVKNFGLIGVNSQLQFGKGGTHLNNNAGTFNFKAVDNTTDAAITTASITSSAGNITLTTGNVVLSNSGLVTLGDAGSISRSATGVYQFSGTGAIIVPIGTSGQQPGTPVPGMFRYNSTDGAMEFYNTGWSTLSTTGASVSSFQTSLDGLTPSTSTTGAVTLAGTLGVASGGTGKTSLTANGVLLGNDTDPVNVTAAGVQYNVLTVGAGGLPAFGSVNLAQSAAVTGILPLANGGTNSANTGSNGSIVYNNGTSLINSTVGVLGQVLTSSGAGAPTWTTASTTVTTNEIVQGDGAGVFTANGATFVGSGSTSGVTLNGTVTNATDAATKAYVDTVAAGLSWKHSVRAGTTVAGTLATSFAAGQVIDGYTLVLGDRILIKNQVDGTENGIYIVTAGTPTRSLDMPSGSNANSSAMFVEEGTVQKSTAWVETADPAVVGTDSLVFTQFSGSGSYLAGSGLTLTGNTFSANTDGVTTFITGNNIAVKSSSTANQVLLSQGTGNVAAWGALPLSNSNAVTGDLAAVNGGTGFASYTVGDILYANSTTTLAKLPIGTSTQVLHGGTTPSYGAVSLTTDVSGTLPVANGGTGDTTFTAGQVLYGNGASPLSTSANFTFDGTSLLTVSGAAPITIDGSTGTVSATATNGAITLAPAGTGSVLMLLNAGTTAKVSITGPTDVQYATSLGSNDLVNKYYVDNAASASGTIKAVSATFSIAAAGTFNIGAVLPAGATILSVKANVTALDTGSGTLSVGKSGSVAAYMTTTEVDNQVVGIYVAEDMVTEVGSVQVIGTVAGTPATGSVTVFVTYQVA